MTQSTILATGITAATSTDIVVAAGSVVTVGIFCATIDLPVGLGWEPIQFSVLEKTPGADNKIDTLNYAKQATVLSGPGTYRVSRPAYTGSPFGVFLEV